MTFIAFRGGFLKGNAAGFTFIFWLEFKIADFF